VPTHDAAAAFDTQQGTRRSDDLPLWRVQCLGSAYREIADNPIVDSKWDNDHGIPCCIERRSGVDSGDLKAPDFDAGEFRIVPHSEGINLLDLANITQ
jgi:hypothetical protein